MEKVPVGPGQVGNLSYAAATERSDEGNLTPRPPLAKRRGGASGLRTLCVRWFLIVGDSTPERRTGC
jgi:hypothetical protein